MIRFVLLAATIGAAMFQGADAGEIAQSIEYVYQNEAVPQTITFEPFDTQAGRRELTGVELSFNGEMSMDVLVENFDPQAYAEDEWKLDAYQSVLLAFDQTPAYPNGGPFFGLGSLSLIGLTGDLTAGTGGSPFDPGTPGDQTVSGTASSGVDYTAQVGADELDYFASDDGLTATLGAFTELLITPPPGGFFINSRTTRVEQSGSLSMTYRFDLVGDLNQDNTLDANDIDGLYQNLGASERSYDLNRDNFVDQSDVDFLVLEILDWKYGDSNGDGHFDSSDLVAVFQVGEYEDGIEQNSSWSEGDWNGDGDFTTSDLVFVFDRGGEYYEQPPAAIASVPEPATVSLPMLSIFVGILRRRRWAPSV